MWHFRKQMPLLIRRVTAANAANFDGIVFGRDAEAFSQRFGSAMVFTEIVGTFVGTPDRKWHKLAAIEPDCFPSAGE
jgi:hypothetical protein